MSKLEVNKCYALLTSTHIVEVIKVLPSDNASFANFFRVESISLRLGIMQAAYVHKDVNRNYVEISEEDYQKFFHMWKVYCESLKSARLKLEQKLSYDI